MGSAGRLGPTCEAHSGRLRKTGKPGKPGTVTYSDDRKLGGCPLFPVAYFPSPISRYPRHCDRRRMTRGRGWFATRFLRGPFIRHSMPVSPGDILPAPLIPRAPFTPRPTGRGSAPGSGRWRRP